MATRKVTLGRAKPPQPLQPAQSGKVKVVPGVITGVISAKEKAAVEATDLHVFASWQIPRAGSSGTEPADTKLGSVKKTADGRFSRSYSIRNVLPGLPISVSASSLGGRFTAEVAAGTLGTEEGKSGVNLFLEA